MTPRRLQLGLCGFAALSSAVVFNTLWLQGARLRGHPALEIPGDRDPSLTRALRDSARLDTQSASAMAAAETVRAVARELDQRGYASGNSDGALTPSLRAAILAYEVDQGLPLTAEPSEALLRTIILGADAVAPLSGGTASGVAIGPRAHDLIAAIQRDLAGLGYGPVPPDGRLTDALSHAISRFEHDQRLTPTGRITAPLVTRLARLMSQKAPAQH